MGKRGTRKPCHGCGGTEWRRVDEICSSCKSLLRDGELYRELEKKHAESHEYLRVEIPDNWCKPVYYSIRHWNGLGENEVGSLLKELAALLVECPVKMHRWWNDNGTEYESLDCSVKKLVMFKRKQRFERWEHSRTVYMRRDMAIILHKLHLAIEKTMAEMCRRGEAYGKNMLVQLAKGELSVKEYNEK